jgi:transcriptional regulator of acetoin/glycerol metabolism
MNQQSPTSAIVERARQMFFVDGADPGNELAPYIRRSWHRCAARPPSANVGADAAMTLHGDDLHQRREAATWLRRCAQPELDGLAEHALRQGCVVILSDASGLILDEIGSPDFLPKAHRLALSPGVDWSEAVRGTNAIGTVLLEREALMVLGGEHFLPQNGLLGCAAAPIFDATGKLVGVLDISGESIQVDVHALGLVRLAATQLEHRMMSAPSGRPAGQLLRFHRRPGLLGTPREGLLQVRDGVVVGANRSALHLLGLGWHETLGAEVRGIFGARWQRLQNAPGLVASSDGQQWAASIDAPPQGFVAAPRPAVAAAPPDLAADAVAPLLARALRVAAQGITILVTGETGSGKEVFVRRLHRAGLRCAGPLVAVNCAALPESLIEAELFGYEEGAFTGARRRGLPGRLREADKGMLFLDEIGDMPLSLQTRLLRVLEERVVRPLGSAQDVAVDFDLVCATHHDLETLVQQGRFRQDLLYRLQGYVVAIPPLRERPDRLGLIVEVFQSAGAGARDICLSDAALQDLAARAWPGNLRELSSTLRSLVALAEDGSEVGVTDLAAIAMSKLPAPPAADPPPEASGLLDSLTRQAVHQALAGQAGNVAAAARQLGLHRSTVYRYLARKSS